MTDIEGNYGVDVFDFPKICAEESNHYGRFGHSIATSKLSGTTDGLDFIIIGSPTLDNHQDIISFFGEQSFFVFWRLLKKYSKIDSHVHQLLCCSHRKLLTNSSDSFTNLEFRIYDFFNEHLL